MHARVSGMIAVIGWVICIFYTIMPDLHNININHRIRLFSKKRSDVNIILFWGVSYELFNPPMGGVSPWTEFTT